MADLTELLVQDAEAWHAWLGSHHADHPGVWLVLHKQGGQTYSEGVWSRRGGLGGDLG